MKAALLAFLTAHARRENRTINGQGHQFIVFCECPLCVGGRDALKITESEYEVTHDSDPPERVTPEPEEDPEDDSAQGG